MIIKGDVDEIRFRNEENGFSIVVLDVDGDPLIATGVFPPVVEGQRLSLDGSFVIHKKYGRQFKAEKIEIEAGSGIDGIIRYLGSGIVKGIGPALALRIVSAFGEKTFDVIEHSPMALSKVKGISVAGANKIRESFMQIKEMQDAIMALQSYDIPLGTAMKIYKKYGKETQEKVSSNPYRLIEDIDGIGFVIADRIASAAGISRESEFRLSAGIVYVLKEVAVKSGNTCYPLSLTLDESAALLQVDREKIEGVLQTMIFDRRIKRVEVERGDESESGLALPSVYRAEKNAAVLLARLMAEADRTRYDVGGDIANYEKVRGITLAPEQKTAVTVALSNGVTLITGGPGTGKTTIIRCILDIFEKIGKNVMLMAPTGRAAKRMSEATDRTASTVHRACGIGRDDYCCGDEKLTCDVAIIDEFSMVDVFLFEALLKRLPSSARLIMVGDKDQLPSVGAGNVLADLIKSDSVPYVKLTAIYRQAKESLIVTNAHAVNRGEMPILDDKTRDFFYLSTADVETLALRSEEMVERAAKFVGVEPQRVQVLCPMKNGVAGAINLNKRLQERLNPHGKQGAAIAGGEYFYREGDKVMHVVNNYELEWKIYEGYSSREGSGVFNGDIGEITEINQAAGNMTVTFEDGRVAVYTPDIYNQLVLAYAITVHKSQGSEFDAVVIPVTGGGPMIMTRNLLYTAITRAKKMVVLLGEKYHIKKMVENDYVAYRYSLLSGLLIKAKTDGRALFGDDF